MTATLPGGITPVTDQHDDAPPPDPFTAGIQLQTAIDQLTEPTVVALDRDPAPGTDAWQQQKDDADLADTWWIELADATTNRDIPRAARLLRDLELIAARQDTRQTPTVTVPSLIHQLQDAVPTGSETSSSGSSPAGSRSPIAVAALDLLTEIAHVARVRAGIGAPALTDQLRTWAGRVCNDETQVVRAAELAADWPDRIRTLLDPPKKWTMPGACPQCGETTAYVDQDGDRVRRPVIEFDPKAERARCLRCPARWVGEQQLRQLNKALTEEAS